MPYSTGIDLHVPECRCSGVGMVLGTCFQACKTLKYDNKLNLVSGEGKLVWIQRWE